MQDIILIQQTKDGIVVRFDPKYDLAQILGILEVAKNNVMVSTYSGHTVNFLTIPANTKSSPLQKGEKCVDKQTAIKYYIDIGKAVQLRCQKIMSSDDNAKYYIDETLLTKL